MILDVTVDTNGNNTVLVFGFISGNVMPVISRLMTFETVEIGSSAKMTKRNSCSNSFAGFKEVYISLLEVSGSSISDFSSRTLLPLFVGLSTLLGLSMLFLNLLKGI